MPEPGLYLVAYQSHPSAVLMPAETFERYLVAEGLERIVARRAERGESERPGRELFTRCAKVLLQVGNLAGSGHDRPVGLPLELVPEDDPYTLVPGDSLRVRLLYRGRPVAGTLVVAFNKRRQPQLSSRQRTNTDGRMAFSLDRPGVWLVKAVHMVPAPPGTGADWASFWASLSFEL